MITLDLVNNVLSLTGERPLASSTGSLGRITKNALTTAIYSVVQQTRASDFEQFLTFTATNADYLVPVGVIPATVAQVNKVFYRASALPNSRIVQLKEQSLEYLSYFDASYALVGANLYLTPTFARPIDIFASVLNVPDLTSDGAESGIPKYMIGAVSHLAASILCVSYLDDSNGAAIQRNIADELITLVRNQQGRTRGKSFNLGGWNV